jgi:hypothetical protein
MATKSFTARTEERDIIMKSRRITLQLAVAVATAFTLNLMAAEAFFSPRAKANQTPTVLGVTKDKLDRANPFKHRGDLAFHPTVIGVGNDRDLVPESRRTSVSPRAAETFLHFIGSARRAKACCCCVTETL